LKHEIVLVSEGTSWQFELEQLKQKLSRGTVGPSIDLAFIDQSPWDARTVGLYEVREHAKVVVIHDVDYFPENKIWGLTQMPTQVSQFSARGPWIHTSNSVGRRDYSPLFKFWVEIFPKESSGPTGPPTLVASNFVDITEWFEPLRESSIVIKSTDPA
jgi:hypothetical protein